MEDKEKETENSTERKRKTISHTFGFSWSASQLANVTSDRPHICSSGRPAFMFPHKASPGDLSHNTQDPSLPSFSAMWSQRSRHPRPPRAPENICCPSVRNSSKQTPQRGRSIRRMIQTNASKRSFDSENAHLIRQQLGHCLLRKPLAAC